MNLPPMNALLFVVELRHARLKAAGSERSREPWLGVRVFNRERGKRSTHRFSATFCTDQPGARLHSERRELARGAPSCVRYRARPASSYSELFLLAVAGLAVERESV